GIGIAVLSNRHDTKMNLAIVNNFLDRLLALTPCDWNGHLLKVVRRDEENQTASLAERIKRRQAGSPPHKLAEYAGKYKHQAYGEMLITESNERLAWQWLHHRRELIWSHDEEFNFDKPIVGEQGFSFLIENGQITGLRIFDVSLRK